MHVHVCLSSPILGAGWLRQAVREVGLSVWQSGTDEEQRQDEYRLYGKQEEENKEKENSSGIKST